MRILGKLAIAAGLMAVMSGLWGCGPGILGGPMGGFGGPFGGPFGGMGFGMGGPLMEPGIGTPLMGGPLMGGGFMGSPLGIY